MTYGSFTSGTTLFALEHIFEVLFCSDNFFGTLLLQLMLHLVLVLTEVVIQFYNRVVLLRDFLLELFFDLFLHEALHEIVVVLESSELT